MDGWVCKVDSDIENHSCNDGFHKFAVNINNFVVYKNLEILKKTYDDDLEDKENRSNDAPKIIFFWLDNFISNNKCCIINTYFEIVWENITNFFNIVFCIIKCLSSILTDLTFMFSI